MSCFDAGAQAEGGYLCFFGQDYMERPRMNQKVNSGPQQLTPILQEM